MATLINMQRMSGKDSMPMMAAKKSSRIHTAVGRRGQYRSSEPLGSIGPADSRAAMAWTKNVREHYLFLLEAFCIHTATDRATDTPHPLQSRCVCVHE